MSMILPAAAIKIWIYHISSEIGSVPKTIIIKKDTIETRAIIIKGKPDIKITTIIVNIIIIKKYITKIIFMRTKRVMKKK